MNIDSPIEDSLPTEVKSAVGSSVHLPEIDITELPSKLLPYGEGAKITYRPYTYGELLQFNQSKLSKSDQFKRVLSGINTSFPVDDLSYFDFIYIGLLRKISTFGGDKFTLTFGCSECGKSNNTYLGLTDLEFQDIEIPSLPVILDVDDNTHIEISTLTIKNYLFLLDNDLLTDKTAVYAASVTNMEFNAAKDLISSLTGDIIQDLESVDAMLYLGIKPIDCTCSSCDAKNSISIDEPGVLVSPFRGSSVATRSRIRFG